MLTITSPTNPYKPIRNKTYLEHHREEKTNKTNWYQGLRDLQWTTWNKQKQLMLAAPLQRIYIEHILWTCGALLSLYCTELWIEILCTLIWKISNSYIRRNYFASFDLESLKICIQMSILHKRMQIQIDIDLYWMGYFHHQCYRY